MADSLSSLAQSAQLLIDQLDAGNITFQNFKNSVTPLVNAANNIEVTSDEDAALLHTVHEAESIAGGEAPPPKQK